jgi:hypothetical protein
MVGGDARQKTAISGIICSVNEKSNKISEKEARKQRLSEALRANLKRRKTRARAQLQPTEDNDEAQGR